MAVTAGTVIEYTTTLTTMAADARTKTSSHNAAKQSGYNANQYTGDKENKGAKK